MTREPLTARQAEIVAHIKKCILKNGYAPSTREIGAAMGISSPNGVQSHLRVIERKGYLKRARVGTKALSRAMVVVE